MISRIHSKLGTAGFIISIVALVAALGGGAYAASGGLTGKQKNEVEKIAKKYSGKPGAAGATGAAGPAGSAGAKGDTGAAGGNGSPGTPGSAGSPGAPGAPGKSVEALPIPVGDAACGGRGGAVYEVEESEEQTEICNGSPWTAGGTLPKGATETGGWAFTGNATETKGLAAISFTIPLAAALGAAEVHFLKVGETTPECPGRINNAQAAEGQLCVYGSYEHAELHAITTLVLAAGAYKSGAILEFTELADGAIGSGSWAVTGK